MSIVNAPAEAPISQDPRLRIEELFVALLTAEDELADLDIVCGSDRSVEVEPIHCFVLCREVEPVLRVGQNYFADVAIVVATNIDDVDHEARKGWFKKVLRALTRREPGYVAPDACLLGWSIKSIREVSEGQATGDLIEMRVAAAVTAPA